VRLLDIIVVCDFTEPGEEFLYSFVLSLLHVQEVDDDNAIVGLVPEVLDEGSSDYFVILGVDLDNF